MYLEILAILLSSFPFILDSRHTLIDDCTTQGTRGNGNDGLGSVPLGIVTVGIEYDLNSQGLD